MKLQLDSIHWRPYFLKAIAASLLFTGIVGILAFIIGTSYILLQLIFTGITCTIFSMTGVCAASLHDRDYGRHWLHDLSIAGMVTSVVGAITMNIAVWDIFAAVQLWKASAIFIVLCVVMSIMCMLIPLRRPAQHHSLALRIIISGTIISSIFCGLLFIGYLLNFPLFYEDSYIRMIGALCIISVMGFVSIPILIHLDFVHKQVANDQINKK